MKKKLAGIAAGLILFCVTGMAQAALTTIGTADYNGSTCNLIWDDDNNGNSVVWLDYTNDPDNLAGQKAWADGLGSQLTNINTPGYTVNWGANSWRLPYTVDGSYKYGYNGDPDEDGVYTYTWGYNLANSEMGHLFYEELGNLGMVGKNNENPQNGWGLNETGDFENLNTSWYWSDTAYSANLNYAWNFNMDTGKQDAKKIASEFSGLALRTGNVVSTASVPVPSSVLLLSTGLAGFIGLKRRKKQD